MNRESLNILLKKAYYQQLSEEERKTLKLWLGESGENAEMYKRLMSGQSLTEYSDWVTGFDLSRAMEAIRSKVKRNRQRRIRKSVSWVAACVILCLGITFVFYFTSMDSEQVLTEQMAAQIQPGSAKAILILGDGRQVALDKKPIELLVNKQQMVTGDSRYVFRTLRISDDERGDTGGISDRNSERRGVDVLLFRPYAAFVFFRFAQPVELRPRLRTPYVW